MRDGNEILSSGTFIQAGIAKEALALNFLANPNGHSFVNSGSGTTTTTQGGVSSYTAGNAAGEIIDVTQKGVTNAYGAQGNDTLIGNTANNWLAGGAGSDSYSAGAGDDVLLIDADDLQQNIRAGAGTDIVQVIGDQGVTFNLAQAEVEVAVGGRGNDVFVSGGNSNTFVRAGDGDDLLLGGSANDALSGENGDDVIDGGAGNDLLRGHRGRDRILGGSGDDIIEGGQDDDTLSGGAGNDVIEGGQGDDRLDGGAGIDVAKYAGDTTDYRLVRTEDGLWISDRKGRDGTDFLQGVERLSFANLAVVSVDEPAPLPVKDEVAMANRTTALVIGKAQLLGNDIDFQGESLSIREVLDAVGGAVALNANGDVVFTPDANFKGVMSFNYKVIDSQGHTGLVVGKAAGGGSVEAKASVYLKTPDLPADPQFRKQAWYMTDTNILPVWNDYTGKGVRIGVFESGGPYAVGAETFNYRNPDLAPNVDGEWLGQAGVDSDHPALPTTFSWHATAVAGVIAAARNNEGTIGVAYNAKIAEHTFPSTGMAGTVSAVTSAEMNKFKNYDVVNNSWGLKTGNFESLFGTLPGVVDAVTSGRNGRGTAVVFAAGNDRQSGGNTNYSMLTNSPFTITVASVNAVTDFGAGAQFSNPGASILVSAPGSFITSTSDMLINEEGSTFGAESTTENGTSVAAPIVSGVVALMLEANPRLGYRDIQDILALSATGVDPNNASWGYYNGARTWNGGGMHVSHDYGFGQVDALAAVRLAETWTQQKTAQNLVAMPVASGTLNQAIPDGTGSLTKSLTMGSGLEVEFAQVVVNIDHPRWGDLVVKLISPYGTESVLIDRPGKAPGSGAGVYGDTGTGTLNVALGSTHYRGEQSNGTWTLQVIDAATGQVGTLKDWKLTLSGKPVGVGEALGNDTYVYTNEFAALGIGARATLVDVSGGTDTINAAAVSGNSSINLFPGTTSTIAGRALTVATSTYIENAVGGDGNDALTGNDNNNNLNGGRGGDTLYGNGGIDMLDGGAGDDTLYGGTERDYFMLRKQAGSQDVIGDFSASQTGEKIILVGFDTLQDFSQIGRVQEGVNLRLNLGDGQSIVLNNISTSQFTEQNVVLLYENQYVGDWMLERLMKDVMLPLMYEGSVLGDSYPVLNASQGSLFMMGGNDNARYDTGRHFIDGGDGNDTILANSSSVTGPNWIEGGAGDDNIDGGAGNDVLRGGGGNDLLSGYGGGDFIEGGSGNDRLSGGDGNDVLIGGIGNDRLAGDAGDDVIILDGDQGQIWRSGGNQVISGAVGGSGSDWFWIMPNATSSYVYVSDYVDANNLITDFNVNDPNEKIDLTSIASVAGFEDLIFYEIGPASARITRIDAGGGIFVNLYNVPVSSLKASHFEFAKGNVVAGRTIGNDTLTGDVGGNLLDGRAGADILTGRTGDDTYMVDNAGDVVNELPDGGFDTVRSSVTFALPADVENLVLTGTAAINGTGNAQINRIEGNAAANRLDGGAGEDTLIGGAGNDTYVVDNTADRIVEWAGGGLDIVESSVSYTLADEVEKLTLMGNLAANATGNALNNTLVGNVNHNTLDGGAGADNMTGGDGDDTYLVDNAGDAVNEAAGQGVDSVYALLNYTLPNNVENVTLGIGVTAGTGNALDNVITGNSINNTLTGGVGNDVLDGGAGADTLQGGTGDDSYVVDNASDAVVEALNEGIDTVEAAVSHTLVANVENLVLGGVGNLNGTGNTLNNTLIGNGGNNVLTGYAGDDFLDGAGGVDTLIGGAGNDVYRMDNLSEVVTELAGEGTDTVQSSITYTLGANVENLTLTGTLLINGTGNALDNVISGNDGNNNLSGLAGNDSLNGGTGNDTLNGGAGADSLMGSLGNDTYHIDNSLDVITENAGEGTDTVLVTGTTFTSYTLGVNMENLNFSLAPSMINGTGNELGNVISGNTGNNNLSGGVGNDTLNGSAGNDILDGGLGSDRLNGGTGNDTYLLGRGYGGETVTENDATTGNTDVAQFLSDIAIDQIWFRRLSNNLEVSVIGTNDKLTIGNWYSGNAYHIEQFKTAGGKTLLDSQVDNLVNAMAAFAPPAAGQTTLPPNYQTQLNPVIAANWQ
ncbi:MAG: S8 family serine peptidase [Pseudomonadota bacterium]